MTRALVLVVASLAVAACGAEAGDPGKRTISDPPEAFAEPRLRETEGGNFTLYVSNQSFEISDIDIRIEIDGRVAVDDTFAVGNQHNWVEFVFDLPAGTHVLEATSERGGAKLVRSFRVKKRHWAVVDYWYYAGEHKRFSFSISDGPIAFA